MNEQQFIEAINANPDDRLPQYVYADWLDEMGDPRGEAWRVLIEAGKRPEKVHGSIWQWWYCTNYAGTKDSCTHDVLREPKTVYLLPEDKRSEYFFKAMDDLAIAWVRCHRDAEFEPDLLHRS